jgi:parallel beta-helix repeat protein
MIVATNYFDFALGILPLILIMKLFLSLIIFLIAVTSAFVFHQTGAPADGDRAAHLTRENFARQRPDIRRASTFVPAPEWRTTFPPQRDPKTITVDNNRDFLAAIQRLQAGDRLLVKYGTYQAPIGEAIKVTAQGKADNWVVIAAAPGQRPKLQGTGGTTVHFDGAAYVEIRGFEVVGAAPAQNPSGGGIDANNRAHHIRVIKNIVHDTPGFAIGAGHADYLHFERNTIYNVAWGWLPDDPDHSTAHSAISFYQLTDTPQSQPGMRNIVRGNTIFSSYNTKPFIHGDGITDGNCFILDDARHTQAWGDAVKAGLAQPYTGTTLVENNLCANNGGRGIHVFLSDNLIARNNTLYKNGETPGIDGELSAVESGNVEFYNNIVYAANGTKAIVNYQSSRVTMRNNLLFGSTDVDDGAGTLIQADPLFANPSTDLAAADFSLRSDSPAIGAGVRENCAATYFDGSLRQGGCDLGAFPVKR